MKEVDKHYFRGISSLVNEHNYNVSRYDNYPFITIDNINDQSMHEHVFTLLHSDSYCVIQMTKQDLTASEKVEQLLTYLLGKPICDKNPGKYSFAKVQAEEHGKHYINSHLAQPMHTDEGYTNQYPRYIALYCIKAASTGGDSILVPIKPLYTTLLRQFNAQLEALFDKNAITIQNAYGVENKAILIKLHDDKIGISYSPILQKMRCTEEVFQMFDFITQYIHDQQHQCRFKLKPGQILLLDNCQMLHGRTAFAKETNRLLYRYWFASSYL